MSMRALSGPLAAVLLAAAPLQCPHDNEVAHCWDDAPGDGLWDLAQKFRDAHDEAAARRTLAFLVERYPSSRYAPAAREQLADAGVSVAPPDAGAAAP
jgi:outer membrane protein assembly factor BamD (BamD/ComL family)